VRKDDFHHKCPAAIESAAIESAAIESAAIKSAMVKRRLRQRQIRKVRQSQTDRLLRRQKQIFQRLQRLKLSQKQ